MVVGSYGRVRLAWRSASLPRATAPYSLSTSLGVPRRSCQDALCATSWHPSVRPTPNASDFRTGGVLTPGATKAEMHVRSMGVLDPPLRYCAVDGRDRRHGGIHALDCGDRRRAASNGAMGRRAPVRRSTTQRRSGLLAQLAINAHPKVPLASQRCEMRRGRGRVRGSCS